MLIDYLIMKEQIFQKLNNFYSPTKLEVINESYKHASHEQSPQNGNSHFLIKIKSEKLSKLTRLEGQREIYTLLKEEMNNGVHSISIRII